LETLGQRGADTRRTIPPIPPNHQAGAVALLEESANSLSDSHHNLISQVVLGYTSNAKLAKNMGVNSHGFDFISE
jgi:hypothetical protein